MYTPCRSLAAVGLSLIFLSCKPSVDPPSKIKIVGGRVVNDSSVLAKSTVAILNSDGVASCTATVIGKNHLVSAAHCFSKGQKIHRIGIGRNATPDPGIKILGVIYHPKYHDFQESGDFDLDGNPLYDIAVIAISTDNSSFNLQPVELANKELLVQNAPVIISGFGVTESGRQDAGKLRSVESSIGKIFDRRRELDTRTLGQSGCFGDSGGPLFLKSEDGIKLIGATARGTEALCSQSYSIFTDVTKFQGWMKCSFAKLGVPLDSLVDDASSAECPGAPINPPGNQDDQNPPSVAPEPGPGPGVNDKDLFPKDFFDWLDLFFDWEDSSENCDNC